MAKIKLTIEDFDEAYKKLNEKLKAENITIDVKAIGGYAMMIHGIRKDANGNLGMSEDTDSLVRYTDRVLELISEVGNELGILDDWLNNVPLDLVEVAPVMKKLHWKKMSGYSNINMYVAEVDSLILLKTRAIEMAGLIPRKTDKNDLMNLIKFIGIETIDELNENKSTGYIKDKYPRCYEFLSNSLKIKY